MTHEDSSRFLGINEHPYSHTMTSSFGCWQNDEMWKIDRFDDEGGPKKTGGNISIICGWPLDTHLLKSTFPLIWS